MPPKRKRSASSSAAGGSKKPSTRSKTRSSSSKAGGSSKVNSSSTSSPPSSSPLQSFFQKLEQMSHRKKGKYMSKSTPDRAMVTLMTAVIHRLIAECASCRDDDDSANTVEEQQQNHCQRDCVAIVLSAIVESASRFLNSCEKVLLDQQVTTTVNVNDSSAGSNDNTASTSSSTAAIHTQTHTDDVLEGEILFVERFGRAMIHVTSGAVEAVALLCRDLVHGRSLNEVAASAVLEEGDTEESEGEVEALDINMEDDMKVLCLSGPMTIASDQSLLSEATLEGIYWPWRSI